MKICPKCKKEKELEDFCKHKGHSDGHSSRCKSCLLEDGWERYRRDPHKYDANKKLYKQRAQEKWKLYHRHYSSDYLCRMRSRFFDLYGRSCVCCGETREICLTLDHVIPCRKKRVKGSLSKFVHALTSYKPDRYQVLCFNCNCLKSSGESCPCGGRKESIKPWMLL